MPITKRDKKALELMIESSLVGGLALIECQEKDTKKTVTVVASIERAGRGFNITPLARVMTRKQVHNLNPPDPKNPEGFLEDQPMFIEGRPS